MEALVLVPDATDVSDDEVGMDAEVAEVSGVDGIFRAPSVEQ